MSDEKLHPFKIRMNVSGLIGNLEVKMYPLTKDIQAKSIADAVRMTMEEIYANPLPPGLSRETEVIDANGVVGVKFRDNALD